MHLRSYLILLSAGMVWGLGPAQAFTCPGEGDIKATITKYITTEYWSQAQRDVWQVTNVGNLQFGAFRFGPIGKKFIDNKFGPRDYCPVRFEYKFDVERRDGRKETTSMGADKTHEFYQDDFGDWLFKTI